MGGMHRYFGFQPVFAHIRTCRVPDRSWPERPQRGNSIRYYTMWKLPACAHSEPKWANYTWAISLCMCCVPSMPAIVITAHQPIQGCTASIETWAHPPRTSKRLYITKRPCVILCNLFLRKESLYMSTRTRRLTV